MSYPTGPAGHTAAPSYPAADPQSGFVAPYSQVQPYARLVGPGGRLGAALLDGLLIMLTAFIGWLIWALFVFDRGQTPGKQVLGHVVVDENTGVPFGWGRMALREIVIKTVVGYIAGAITAGVYGLIDACMVFGDRHRTLHDRMVTSVVVHK